LIFILNNVRLRYILSKILAKSCRDDLTGLKQPIIPAARLFTEKGDLFTGRDESGRGREMCKIFYILSKYSRLLAVCRRVSGSHPADFRSAMTP
jgi:hypothetical protein